VIDKRRELVLRLASRGIDPRKIRIQLSGNVLTLSGASVDLRPGHRGYRAFHRNIVLPRNVDAAQVTAKARGSVLTVRLPKRRPTMTDEPSPKHLAFPYKVSDIMTREVRSVAPETFVAEAARAMATFDIGSLPVCEGGRVVGILTDRDVAVRVVARGLDPAGVRVKEIMTGDPLACSPDDALADAEQMMADAQIRRLPVVGADGKLVGYLSTAKIARCELDSRAGRLLRGVSEPGHSALRPPAPAPRPSE
jgi:CBS domain-containing protein